MIDLHAQESSRYFPTGMKWKEVKAEPHYITLDTLYSFVYEIGKDTLVNDIVCKEVFRNGEQMSYWVFEEGEKIWLLTEDYPEVIKIYDFNWHDDEPVYQEYLRINMAEQKKEREYIDKNRIAIVNYNNHSMEYILDSADGTMIRGIGRVTELRRNGSLLSYKIIDPVIPGIVYSKVLWIMRDGVEIFRSETAEEWIYDIPTAICIIPSFHNKKFFDLTGRRIAAPPTRGAYIEDGKVKLKY